MVIKINLEFKKRHQKLDGLFFICLYLFLVTRSIYLEICLQPNSLLVLIPVLCLIVSLTSPHTHTQPGSNVDDIVPKACKHVFLSINRYERKKNLTLAIQVWYGMVWYGMVK